MARKKRGVQRANGKFNPIIPPNPADQQRQAQKTTSYSFSSRAKGRRSQQRMTDIHIMDVDPDKLPNEAGEEFVEGASGDAAAGNAESDAVDVTAVSKESKKRRLVSSYLTAYIKCYLPVRSQERIQTWIPFRASFLDEVLRHDGLGDYTETRACVRCREKGAEVSGMYRCTECVGGVLLCQRCIVREHSRLPLHRIQVRTPKSLSLTPY